MRVPGDKSITHRAVMLASIADGTTRITNFLAGEDCRATVRCMRQLGVEIEEVSDTSLIVHGVGLTGLKPPTSPLDCGNSGTTMRLLAGILAGQPFESVLTGDDSLRKRPMARIIEPLQQMGAGIASESGKAPLTIRGGPLNGITYETPVPSAQIKSCVLLAGLFADGMTWVIERVRTRDHTERMLRQMGAIVDLSDEAISVACGQALRGAAIDVPGDISSAIFFIAAAAALPGSDITMENVGYNSTRTEIIDVLRRLGAQIDIVDLDESASEPTASIRIRGGLMSSETNMLEGDTVPKLIDEIPMLAVLGTQLENGLIVRDAEELRVKETDRIAALVENLRRMGAAVEEFDDGFEVARSHLQGAAIDSLGDHRMAMAFSIAALFAEGETEILNAECSDVSYPGFYRQLEQLSIR
jgi:3-phosphoshikimate 1-carboxyvinyltransferase